MALVSKMWLDEGWKSLLLLFIYAAWGRSDEISESNTKRLSASQSVFVPKLKSRSLSDQTIRRRIPIAPCLIIKSAMKRCRLERQCGCFPDWVQCDNGRCIPKSRVCDRNPDCQHAGYASDDSDERDCGRTFTTVYYIFAICAKTDRPTTKVAETQM